MNTAIYLTSIILSVIALLVSITAIVMVLAQRWSTHQIEWKPLNIPVEEPIKEPEEDEAKALEDVLSMQRKKKKKIEDPLEDITNTSNF